MRAVSLASRAATAGLTAAIVGLSAAHARRPFASSATPVCMLPLYLSERALPMFWLPLVSAKKMPRLMRPAASTVAASRPLARAIARPRSATSLKGVSEACASAGGACMMLNSATYSSISGSLTASK